MTNYGYLIDQYCNTPIKRRNVRAMLPILASWAKAGVTNKTYQDMAKLIGSNTPRLGRELGRINDILKELSSLTGVEIPTPNSLVCLKGSGLPSVGLSYVTESYESMTIEQRQNYVKDLNAEAILFGNKWDWVLSQLGLKAAVSTEDEAAIRSGL